MIDTSLLQDFIAETTEHLEEMEENLLLLEKSPGNSELINSIFRSVHTIKGSAEYLGMEKISSLTHNLESLLDRIRNGNQEISRDIIDVVIASGDVVNRLIEDLVNTQQEQTPIDEPLNQILHFLEQKEKAASEPEGSMTAKAALPYDDEAYDEELYVIFVQNLREGLTEFNNTFASITSGSNPLDIFGKCLELIDSLASSANYMGYDQLSSLYSDLKADIGAFCNDCSSSGETRTIAEVVEVVKKHVAGICKRFEIDEADLGVPIVVPDAHYPLGRSVSEASLEKETDDLALDLDQPLLNEDFLEEPSETEESFAAPAEENTTLTEESSSTVAYQEDYDSELFDIFISQLVEDLGWFKNEAESMDSAADHLKTIDHWKEKLASLRSSSNYMGYDELTRIYKDWESRIDATGNTFTDENEKTWIKVLHSDGAVMLKKIVALFPEADGLNEVLIAEDSLELEAVVDSIASPSSDEFAVVSTQSSMLSDALSDKISQMTMHAETPHEVVTDYLFTDEAPHNSTETAYDDGGRDFVGNDSETSRVEAVDEMEARSGSQKDESPVVEESIANEPTDVSDEASAENTETKSDVDASEDAARDGENKTGLTSRIRSQNIRVDANKIDALMNQVGELVVSRAWFSQLHHEMRDLKHKLLQEENIDKRLSKQISQMTFRLHEATSSLGRAANELQEGVMRIRMLPIARLFNRYPRLIHDLVKDGDKKVDLEIRGEETELDKMVIEKISDPMIHIIRNAIDHGIEKSTERNTQGKPETAKLIIEAYHESNHVVIEVTDDGKGIDPEKLKAKALEKGIMDPVELDRLTDREAMSLITIPGFSTATSVTHTSGRGVGMDVVKKNIEKLNGTVEIDSIVGQETRIRIKLPLTLAIIPALLVRVESELFTVPLSTVEETIKVNTRDIESIEGNEVIYLRNETIPLIRLNRVFNMSTTDTIDEKVFIVIVSNGMNQMGLVVDSMLGQEEVVIKPLEDYLQESSGFSGATILGDGRISLILDIYDLLNISIAKMESRRRTKSALVV